MAHQLGGRPLTDDEFAADVIAVTAAFGDPTRREIYLLARDRTEGVTASEVSEQFGLHANVARHHLDKLASGGYLEVTVERSDGGGAGRPSKRYRVHDVGLRLQLPSRRDDLLVTLLGRALALLPTAEAEAMAEDVGVTYGRQLATAMQPGDAQLSVRTALHAVADALTAHGFAAHAEARGGSLAIIAEHCPFGTTAQQHPVICAVDRGMVKGMLEGLYGDTRPETEASRAMGDEHCVTTVELRHYLDHASTSPPRRGVVDAMVEWLSRAADPGRVHTEGRMVRAAIEEARESVATLCGVRPRQVIFTSGATEAVNAAVWGAQATKVACAAVEHSCVRDASARAAEVVPVPVDETGRVSVDAVAARLREGVSLVHCQWGNHEVGTLQPVVDVVEACHAAGVLVHVDAAQAFGRVPIDLDALGADLVAVSGHKFGGPAGVGALIVRRGLRIPPFVLGGEQERARRGGMENVPAIVGFGVAAASVSVDAEASVASQQTSALLDAALAVPGVVAYGSQTDRLPHIVCVGVEGVEAEAVLLGLDQAGIAAHSGSACSSESLEPSPVLEAMGVDAERSLRLSVGWSTTDEDVVAFAGAFGSVVARLRALSPS